MISYFKISCTKTTPNEALPVFFKDLNLSKIKLTRRLVFDIPKKKVISSFSSERRPKVRFCEHGTEVLKVEDHSKEPRRRWRGNIKVDLRIIV